MRTTTTKTMRTLMAAAIAVCALFAAAPPASAQTLYTITDLGTCVPTALNETRTIVGDCGGPSALSATAVMWDNGVLKSLGKLPKANYSAAHAVNGRGVAVGEGDTGDYRPHPTLYRGGRVIDIDASGNNARAIFINDNGVIVGNFLKGFGGASAWSAVIWTERPDKPGRFDRISLAPYPGGDAKARYGYATGANQALQVVGWVQNTLFGQYGAFWTNDAAHTLALLRPLPGDWTSIAWGVNDLGQAVGESYRGFRGRLAVLWLDDAAHTPVELGTLPGDTESVATAANGLGQVVGLSMSGGRSRPFLWENGQMVEVASLLDGSGVDWTILTVTAINDAGEITGLGLYQGQVRGFLMSPAGQ